MNLISILIPHNIYDLFKILQYILYFFFVSVHHYQIFQQVASKIRKLFLLTFLNKKQI